MTKRDMVVIVISQEQMQNSETDTRYVSLYCDTAVRFSIEH